MATITPAPPRARRSIAAVLTAALAALLMLVTSAPATAVNDEGGFDDVPETHLFYEHIMFLVGYGITSGVGDGSKFAPDQEISRGQMAVFLYKMAGSPDFTPPSTSPFSDVPKTHTFYKHITWLAASGITQGVGDGSRFAPDDSVSRGQMAVFLYKLDGSPAFSAGGSATFGDVPVSHTFYKHIAWLSDMGITSGYASGNFGPADEVSRGQMAAFLLKYYLTYGPWAKVTMLSPLVDGYCPVHVTYYHLDAWGSDWDSAHIEWIVEYEGEYYEAESWQADGPVTGVVDDSFDAPAWPGDTMTAAWVSVTGPSSEGADWYMWTRLGTNLSCPA